MKPKHFSLLIVDDDEMNCDMLNRCLQKQGYTVIIASGGKEALSLTQKHKFDLILLDIIMPDVDGIEVLKSLRREHSLVDLPIIMVSGKHTNKDMVNALSLGANDYVQKPIQFDVLLARIEMLLLRKGLEAELKQVAIQDGLTGLYNRWYFDQVLQKSLENSHQQKKPLTLLLMDLDQFKQVNDQLGHLKGDDVLREISQLLKRNLRQRDLAFRYGGDEFVALIEANAEQSLLITKRLKQAFVEWLAGYDVGNINLGLSMGQVCWEPGMNLDPEHLLKQADDQLYQQKRDKHVDELQQQLSEKSEQVHFQTSFLEGVDEMIVATDLQGKVIYVNQAFVNWSELSLEKLLNQTLASAIPSFEIILEQVEQKKFWAHKIKHSQSSRAASTILVKPSELKQERGTPYGYVFFASDISELEKTHQQLVKTQHFLERLSNEDSLQPLLQLILEEAVDLIPNANSGTAQLFDEQTDHFRFSAAVGWSFETLSTIELPRTADIHPINNPDRPAIIETDLTQHDVQHLDPAIVEKFATLGGPALSALSLPIYLDGKLVGKFNIDSTSIKNAFNDVDLALLESLVPQIELAVRRAKERQDLEKTNERLTQTERLLQSLNKENNLQPILQLILQEALDLIPHAECGSAELFDEQAGIVKFVAAVGWPLDILSKIKVPLNEDLYRIHAPQYLSINEFNLKNHDQQYLDEATAEKFAALGPPPLSTISLPIHIDGQVFGRFNLDNTSIENAFNASDIELLSSLTPQIELTVRRAKENEHLQEQQKRLQLAFQLGSELSKLDDVYDMAKHAADWAVKRYGYDLVGIALIKEDHLEVAAYCGSTDASRYVGSSLPFDAPSLATKTLRTQEAVFIDDVTQVSDYLSVDSRTRSELVVPITLKNEKIGALNFESFRVNSFSQQDQELAYFLADQLAIAMSSLKREQDLMLSEQNYRSLFELAPDAILLLDEDRRFVNVNPQMCELLGYSKEEFLQLSLQQIIAPEERESSDHRLQEVLEGKSFKTSYVRQVLKKDGSIIPLEAKTILILDDQGNPKHVMVMGRDISDARGLEQELKASEHKYRHLVEDSQVGVCIVQDGYMQFANKRMIEISGYHHDELLKVHCLDLCHPGDRTFIKAQMQKYLNGEFKQANYHWRLIHKKGHVVYMEVFSSLTEYKGKPAIIDTIIDITAQKVAEEREQLLQHQLEKTALHTVSMLAKTLEERDQQTLGHCQRLSDLCLAVGEKLKLPSDRLISLRHAALLHDIGKIGVPEHILNKKEQLSNSEWEIIKKHVEMSFELVREIAPLKHTANIILQHHENWNGTGYPNGFKGEDILLEARILSVIDAYDAMTKDRPYRKAMSQEKALKTLKEGAGFQWDPVVVKVFLKSLNEE